MASTRQLKSRIRSVKSTKQITKAMQMVAASKMRRTQDAARASAPYEKLAQELMTYLASQGATDDHPLFKRRQIKNRLIILVAADKGLAGAYNTNVLRKYLQLLKRDNCTNNKPQSKWRDNHLRSFSSIRIVTNNGTQPGHKSLPLWDVMEKFGKDLCSFISKFIK
jgi:ATP synthase F1 gamma subunit